MPWRVARSATCPTKRPWAVILKSDSSVVACHATEMSAHRQLAALYASENAKKFDPHQLRDPHTGEWTDAPGGVGVLDRPEKPAGGGSVADNLDLPKSGKVREGVDEAIEAIDSVLNLPELPRIPVKPSGGKHKGGAYKRKRAEDGSAIPEAIQITTDRPAEAFTHEFGHFLDDQLLSTHVTVRGRRQAAFGSFMAYAKHQIDGGMDEGDVYPTREADPDPDLVALMTTIDSTPTIEEMKVATPKDMAAHQYMCRPVEQFARAFNQWVTIRSGNQRLLDDLDRVRDPEYAITRAIEQQQGSFAGAGESPHYRRMHEYFQEHPEEIPKILKNKQWPDEEFEPIAAAFDKLFEGRGWLK